MKVNINTNNNIYKYNNYQIKQSTFCGLNDPKTKALFVFDLDGTLATASL